MFFSRYIKNNYGSKRGLLNAIVCKFKYYLGRYRQYQSLPVNGVKRFVFICSGNICRSPLAEYVAKQQGVQALSFGLHTRGGDKADARAIAFAASVDIDLSQHLTQNIQDYQPEPGDVLVGMEPKHADELAALFNNRVPITLVGLWCRNPQAYIHDPYNTNSVFFTVCEQQVVNAVKQLVQAAHKA